MSDGEGKLTKIKLTVDIDGVLTLEHKSWEYEDRTPNMDNIRLLKQMYDTGNYTVRLFTARHAEDKGTTIEWLDSYGIEYDDLIMDKPGYDCFIEDKALPFFEEGLHELLSYNIGGSCWRFTHGKIEEGEKHPCWYCGHDIDIGIGDCEECGIVACPSCSKCLCNVPLLTLLTVKKIHKKYCCDLPNFTGHVELEGAVDMNVVKNAKKTLLNCCNKESLL